ncbi:MAG: hypothetical protein NTW94_04215 [Legionellales bacterium]|nr:hypothetical protein [Legionellales bacterium]
MTDDITELDLSKWYSTYGVLTAESVLDRFEVELNQEELLTATHSSRSAYYQLLKIPMRNIFNGIILQQAHDYQVYAQKQFIDYLLSGEAGKDDSMPGAPTRQDLEDARLALIDIGENFNNQEIAHQTLIADSQAELIDLAFVLEKSMSIAIKKINRILQNAQLNYDASRIEESIRVLLIQFDGITEDSLAMSSSYWNIMSQMLQIKLNHSVREPLADALMMIADPRRYLDHTLAQYLDQTRDMGIYLRGYRSQFYNLVLRATELINLLPDYMVDKVKEEENRSSLYFDAQIGGE